MINEAFFDTIDNPIENVCEKFKNLFLNLRGSIGEFYKLEFFQNELIKSLERLKNDDFSSGDIIDNLENIVHEINPELLEIMKVEKLFYDLCQENKDDTIDSYIENIGEMVLKLYIFYKIKSKNDKKYQILIHIPNNSENENISYKKFLKEKYLLQIELLKMQEWCIKNDKKVLVLFEGRDAAGKGSNIETFSEFMNPSHFRVETFGIPTKEESENWFKRYKKVMPKKGEIVLFDRSWYNRAVVEPAMGYCSKEQYHDFMDCVNEFENEIIDKKDIILIKLWFNITKEKQEFRFELRKRDPLRYWKYSENDMKSLKKWDVLTPYIEKMFNQTNTIKSPWIFINSNNKLNSQLKSIKIVLNKIDYDQKDKNTIVQKGEDKKVIFVDFHGTLITDIQFSNGHKLCNSGWNKKAIDNLNELTNKTNADIVIISDCLKHYKSNEVENFLRQAGVTGNIKGSIVFYDKEKKGEQINNWLSKNKQYKQFVILDDKNSDIKSFFKDNFVKLDSEYGFSDVKKLYKAFKILNNISSKNIISEIVNNVLQRILK